MRHANALVIAGTLLCVAAQVGRWGAATPLVAVVYALLLGLTLKHREGLWTDLLLIGLIAGTFASAAPGYLALAASAVGILFVQQGTAMAASLVPGAPVARTVTRAQLRTLGETLALTVLGGATIVLWRPEWNRPWALPALAGVAVILIGLLARTAHRGPRDTDESARD